VTRARGGLDARTVQLVGVSVVMSVTAQLMLRRGMAQAAGSHGLALLRSAALSGWVVGGLLVFATGTAVWLLVLSRVDLAVAYPLGSLSYVLVTLLSAALLHEQVPLLRWIGTALILTGIMVVARGERGRQRPGDEAYAGSGGPAGAAGGAESAASGPQS
jgi:drug/metabolite transporter (DMT)-like permease